MPNTYKALAVTNLTSDTASITFSNINAGYTDLAIYYSFRAGSGATDGIGINFNSDGTSFSQQYLIGTGTSVSGGNDAYSLLPARGWVGYANANTTAANRFSNGWVYIHNYSDNVLVKNITADSVYEQQASLSVQSIHATRWNKTTAINSITLTLANSGNIAAYSTATLYGIFNSDVSTTPATPTIGTATAGAGSASITFTGVANAASYTMTSTPSSITATGTTSPITVSGLTNETAYTFKVKANNPIGSSAESAASNSVTPSAAAYESISTSTVSGSSVAYVEFTSVPSTYKNLQIRFMAKTVNGGVSSSAVRIEYNSDTTTANYYSGYWLSNGITFSTAQTAGPNYGVWIPNSGAVASSGFGHGVVDIFDYTNSNKFTQSMSNSGYADSNYQQVHQSTQAWRNTTTPTTIRLTPYDGNIAVGSYFALYGIEG